MSEVARDESNMLSVRVIFFFLGGGGRGGKGAFLFILVFCMLGGRE